MPSFTYFRVTSEEVATGWSFAGLWLAVLAGPLLWLSALEASYVLSYFTCGQEHPVMLHLIFWIPAVILPGIAFWLWQRFVNVHQDAAHTRRWLALVGVVNAIGFAIVLIATDVPVMNLLPCR
jgi:hypothetical protein